MRGGRTGFDGRPGRDLGRNWILRFTDRRLRLTLSLRSQAAMAKVSTILYSQKRVAKGIVPRTRTLRGKAAKQLAASL